MELCSFLVTSNLEPGYLAAVKFSGTVKLFGWPSGGAGNGEARRTIARISWSSTAAPVPFAILTEVTLPLPVIENVTAPDPVAPLLRAADW